MDSGYDTGPIISSEWYEFPFDADCQSIRKKVYREVCILAVKVLASIQNSDLKPSDATSQDIERGKYWYPIPDKNMDAMLQELQLSSYKYQCL